MRSLKALSLFSQETLVTEANSYRPISLLPEMTKFFEELLLKRIKPILNEKQIIPAHHFDSRNKQSTIDQVHRITTVIKKTLEEKKFCSAIFLDKVWH